MTEKSIPPSNKPYLLAFASLNKIYSYRNIFLNHFEKIANEIYKKHYNSKENMNFYDDEYSYWSSIARALHFKYKLYSSNIFDHNKKRMGEITREEIDKYCQSIKVNLNTLTWLEHRRWNAFMRTKGFISPTPEQWDNYAFKDGNKHKNLELKLHPCIRESSKTININFCDWKQSNEHQIDFLDDTSYMIFGKKKVSKCDNGKCSRKEYLEESEDCKEESCKNEKKCIKGGCIKIDYKKYDSPEYDLPVIFKEEYVYPKDFILKDDLNV